MLFKTVLDALETVIKNSDANAKIRVYRRYAIEPGVHSVPCLVLGSSLSMKVTEEYLGAIPTSQPYLCEVSVSVQILTRRYPSPGQIVRAAEAVDVAQNAVCTALRTDATQGDITVQSWITSIQPVAVQNEYYGLEISFVCQMFEPSV